MKRGLGVTKSGGLSTSIFDMRVIKLTASLIIGGFAAGCAGGGGMQMASAGGGSCSSLRSELSRLDSRGVPSIIEAKNAGKRVSSKKQALINRYNSILNTYLSAKCHAKR